MTTTPLTPGLLALHGNCAETLAQALIDWAAAHPLAPLEQEVVLVQSNGTAEWFKMLQAQQRGICAATRVELPARFLWRSWRQILGTQRVPSLSPLDEAPMAWRLMRLLPDCAALPDFAPIARFLRADQPQRLWQLASRLADLFDQYQVYRSDWLAAWEAGRDVLPGLPGQAEQPLPPGQAWQPQLWRTVLADLSAQERAVTRPALRQEVLHTLQTAPVGSLPVARRVLLLGLTHVPLSMLEFLAALSRHSQVVLAVPNPCRFHWADAISGRELLRQQRRRHPLRNGQELADIALEQMHLHAHPLLAAWGRQSRDYVRLLDNFESSSRLSQDIFRVDLYEEAATDKGNLLQQVQRSIRDLLPLAEHPRALQPQHRIPADDRSIVLHSAHSLVRELEVLHDHLLTLFATPPAPGQAPLQPRNVIVMLPDIASAAPAIRAVFGQHKVQDARHIPFAIADLAASASSPLAAALGWLLRLPQQRCRLSELSDLLDVPALAARLGLAAEDAPQLRHWMREAGIRWGLDAAQRSHLNLAACGDTNSAWFGLQRMLLGYASGNTPVLDAGLPRSAAWQSVEPFADVGGLDAELVGILSALVQRLLAWWQEALVPTTPLQWAQRLRTLLADLFAPQDNVERAILTGLEQALDAWLQACEHARFEAPLPLQVVQPVWLQALQAPALEQRFHAGGVTFCTLMPMRAIPFEVVCLLGMNEGDYPRRSSRNSFDLMQQPGQYRPGDRARRDHDRQLMLDALLSARQQLYISWTGQHVRDNSPQPPSVLVAQLCDYLRSGWRAEGEADGAQADGNGTTNVVSQRSQRHPLQPFSRQYFEQGSPWHTYAKEWRSAHAASPPAPPTPNAAPEAAAPLTLAQLVQFFRDPAKSYLRQQLQVVFALEEDSLPDEELFGLSGLDAYQRIEALHTQISAQHPRDHAALEQLLTNHLTTLERAGQLPLASLGQQEKTQLHAMAHGSLSAWLQLQQHFSHPASHQALDYQHAGVVLHDWLDGLRCRPGAAQATAILLSASKLLDDKADSTQRKPQPHQLLPLYLRSLVASACGQPLAQWVVGRNGVLYLPPMDCASAPAALNPWLAAWQAGQAAPLPLPCKTALAWAEAYTKELAATQDCSAAAQHAASKAQACYTPTFQAAERDYSEGGSLHWQRLFADFEQLTASGQLAALAPSLYQPLLDWGHHAVRVVAADALPAALQELAP